MPTKFGAKTFSLLINTICTKTLSGAAGVRSWHANFLAQYCRFYTTFVAHFRELARNFGHGSLYFLRVPRLFTIAPLLT